MGKQSNKTTTQTNHSSYFVLNVWEERLAGNHTEWRGEILHVDSGLNLRFEDWPELVEMIAAALHTEDGIAVEDYNVTVRQPLGEGGHYV